MNNHVAVRLSSVLLIISLLTLCSCERSQPVGESGQDQDLAGGRADARPNVVLIIIDTLRADKLSCYGFPKDTTPELDALAAQGVRFARVIAQCSWTRPSIGSMLTSRYPRSLGLYKEKDEILNDSFVTMAELLQAHGYGTYGITANPVINSVFNMHQGFDTHVDSDVNFSWMQPEDGKATARNHRLASAQQLFEAVLRHAKASSNKPHYVQINIMEMHEYWRKKHCLTRHEFNTLFPDDPNTRYLQALRQVSVDIEAFVQALAALPGWRNTLFVLTSDHGQGLDDHKGIPHSGAHGRILYESQVVVPLILYHPEGIWGTKVIERPVRLLDIMPTVADLLKISPASSFDGTSLLPLLEADTPPPALPERFITETEFRKFNKIGVYAPEWKYFQNRDGHPGLNPQELQPAGGRERGRRSDQIVRKSRIAAELKRHLNAWEKEHPKAPATRRIEGLSEAEEQQLEAIGYLQ